MRIKKPEKGWKLRKLDLIIAFDYQLSEIIKLQMEGLALISVDTLASKNLNPTVVRTSGDMKLIQAIPMSPQSSSSFGRSIFTEETWEGLAGFQRFISGSDSGAAMGGGLDGTRRVMGDYFDHLEHQNMQYFLEKYMMERNETLQYDYQHSVSYGSLDQSYIDVKMVIRVPAEQEVMYSPSFWQIIKMTWVQYFTIFLIFYVILHRLYLNFVVTGGVFDTIEKSEIDYKNCKVSGII